MTVRIDPALLESLRARARSEDRSVSAEVVRLIRAHVQPPADKTPRAAPTMGMFPDLEAPELEDFKALRSKASRALASARAARAGRGTR